MLRINSYKLLVFLIILFSYNWAIAQMIEVKIDKDTYSKNEIIEVEYISSVIIDSVQDQLFPDFKILKNKPSKIDKILIDKGKTYHYSYITYSLKPKKTGKLKIESPIFFTKKGLLKGKEIIVNIIDTSLSIRQSEINKRAYKTKQLYKAVFKPKNTFRYVISDDIGYIEKRTKKVGFFIKLFLKKKLKN
ncbi:MAG: BatD family protein [Flavobacteriaceae bacterium]|nr:BatD family protein [Flavobacteriaceae bacterium]